jgi:D-hydroxyproline dehydrogenase subunit gamma
MFITVSGKALQATEGTTVAVAMIASEPSRISLHGERRVPFCGMGICMECCARVNGVEHRRSCQLLCEPGMVVVTK